MGGLGSDAASGGVIVSSSAMIKERILSSLIRFDLASQSTIPALGLFAKKLPFFCKRFTGKGTHFKSKINRKRGVIPEAYIASEQRMTWQ